MHDTPPMSPRTHLGAALKAVRERAEISQDAVGSAVGLAQGTISDVEVGRRHLRDDRLVRIEGYLGCAPGILVEAAAKDRRGIMLPTGMDDRDGLAVALMLGWRTMPAKKIAALWAAVRAA